MELKQRERQHKIMWMSVPGVGRKTLEKVRLFLDQHKVSWEESWRDFESFVKTIGLSEYQRQQQHIFQKQFSAHGWFEYLDALDAQAVSEDDPLYPPILRVCHDHPPLLFMKGKWPLETDSLVAIVGTRHPTPTGITATNTIATELVDLGHTIVSGLMYGVDCEAHTAALRAGGKSIAVLGYGFETLEKSQSAGLARDLLAGGHILISQYIPWTPAKAGHFPARNKVIAGLSLGVVITEAALKSGSHLTAEYAREYRRPVMVLPTNITNPYVTGFQHLIQSGGELVTSGLDINGIIASVALTMGLTAQEHHNIKYRSQNSVQTSAQTTSLRDNIKQLVYQQPMTEKQLLDTTHCSTSQLLIALSHLELLGQIERKGSLWLSKA